MKALAKNSAFYILMGVVMGLGARYFTSPLTFALADASSQLVVTYGQDAVYQEISQQDQDALIALLECYHYTRTWNTFFSDGSLPQDGRLQVDVYQNDIWIGGIGVTEDGAVSADSHSYEMAQADVLIAAVLDILN